MYCGDERTEGEKNKREGKKKEKTWSVAALCHRRRFSITLSVCFHTPYQARLINKKDERAKGAGLPAGWMLLLLLGIRSREQGAGNVLLGAAAATGWRLLFARSSETRSIGLWWERRRKAAASQEFTGWIWWNLPHFHNLIHEQILSLVSFHTQRDSQQQNQ